MSTLETHCTESVEKRPQRYSVTVISPTAPLSCRKQKLSLTGETLSARALSHIHTLHTNPKFDCRLNEPRLFRDSEHPLLLDLPEHFSLPSAYDVAFEPSVFKLAAMTFVPYLMLTVSMLVDVASSLARFASFVLHFKNCLS